MSNMCYRMNTILYMVVESLSKNSVESRDARIEGNKYLNSKDRKLGAAKNYLVSYFSPGFKYFF